MIEIAEQASAVDRKDDSNTNFDAHDKFNPFHHSLSLLSDFQCYHRVDSNHSGGNFLFYCPFVYRIVYQSTDKTQITKQICEPCCFKKTELIAYVVFHSFINVRTA